jgi:hypothetical protein
MRRYVEVYDATTVVGQHDEHEQNAERGGGDGEEADRRKLGDVIGEERPPGLRGGRAAAAGKVSRHSGLCDPDAQLPELAVDGRRAARGRGRMSEANRRQGSTRYPRYACSREKTDDQIRSSVKRLPR